GCAVALASLGVFREELVLEKLRPKIVRFGERLEGLKATSPLVREVRRCGFVAGIALGQPDGSPFPPERRFGAEVCAAARAHGLLTRPIRDTVVIMPPLCTSEEEIDLIFDALGKVLA